MLHTIVVILSTAWLLGCVRAYGSFFVRVVRNPEGRAPGRFKTAWESLLPLANSEHHV